MVVDENNIIRYLEIVPMSQLPNFEAAYDTARRIVSRTQRIGMAMVKTLAYLHVLALALLVGKVVFLVLCHCPGFGSCP